MHHFVSLLTLLLLASSVHSSSSVQALFSVCKSTCIRNTTFLNPDDYFDVLIREEHICSGTSCFYKIKASCNCYIHIYKLFAYDGRLQVFDGFSDDGRPICTCENTDCDCDKTTSGDVAFVAFTSQSDTASFTVDVVAQFKPTDYHVPTTMTVTDYDWYPTDDIDVPPTDDELPEPQHGLEETDYQNYYDRCPRPPPCRGCSYGAGTVIGCIVIIMILVVVIVIVIKTRKTWKYNPATPIVPSPAAGYTTKPLKIECPQPPLGYYARLP